tara:strand:+ start:20477 stop:21022 length:546 start_codon:yes stop_codon:yes gene_type:complete
LLKTTKLTTHHWAHGIFLTCLLFAFNASADPATACPVQVIKRDQIKAVVARRQTTFKHCLECEGDSCELTRWPESGKDFAKVCKALFCTPKKIPRTTFAPDEVDKDGAFNFTYTIGKNGRVKDIEVTDVIGDITYEAALKAAEATYKRRRYEPIIIDGTAYELSNLQDGVKIDAKIQIRKN